MPFSNARNLQLPLPKWVNNDKTEKNLAYQEARKERDIENVEVRYRVEEGVNIGDKKKTICIVTDPTFYQCIT